MENESNVIIAFLEERYATRAIESDALPAEAIDEIAEAVRLTPSCMNNQPWRFLFLLSDEARAKGHECLTKSNRQWAERAPLLVFGYSAEEDDCRNPDGRVYHQFDLGMATMNLMMAATSRRLVARPMAGFDAAKLKAAFELPENARPLVAVAVGYPSDDDSHVPEYARAKTKLPRERKPVDKVVKRL
jgi:nitroreductase